MIILIILSILCFMLSGVSKSAADTLVHCFKCSIFLNFKVRSFWDGKISYLNKYKDRDPLKGEAFPLSTTWLVCLTDGWHLANAIEKLTNFIGIILLICIGWDIKLMNLVYIFTIIYGSRGLGFTITYDWLFKRSTWR